VSFAVTQLITRSIFNIDEKKALTAWLACWSWNH